MSSDANPRGTAASSLISTPLLQVAISLLRLSNEALLEELPRLAAKLPALLVGPALEAPAGRPVPDVVVDWQDELRVRVHQAGRPQLSVSEQAGDEAVASANFFLKALATRDSQLAKVVELLARREEGFFRRGEPPGRMTMESDIADEMGLHPSTVSRLVDDKLVSCPAGVFPLHTFFFRGSLETARVLENGDILVPGTDGRSPRVVVPTTKKKRGKR